MDLSKYIKSEMAEVRSAIHLASYNPREITEESKKALKTEGETDLANSLSDLMQPVEEDHQQELAAKGFQAMSQDAGDELYVRFTAIQTKDFFTRWISILMQR